MTIETNSIPGELLPFYSATDPVHELKQVKRYLEDKGWSLGGTVIQSFIDLSDQIGFTDMTRVYMLSPKGEIDMINIGFPSKATYCTMSMSEETAPSKKVDVESNHRKLSNSQQRAIEQTPWNQFARVSSKPLNAEALSSRLLISTRWYSCPIRQIFH